jgi:hypothetical protein
LGRWTGLLRPRPELYDDVLRRVAASPATPPIGRTLLLGLLSQPRAADADSVLAMARRALSDPRGPFVLTISTGTFHSRWTVKFDVPVCMAAYALSSMRADSALLVLWREAGSRDEDARGEIAYALARTNSSRAVPAVLEYATTTWNARALAPGFAVEPVDAKGWPRPPGRDAVRLDAEYRIAAVVGLLTGGPDAPARMRRLTTDRTLAPWLRLYWMANLRGYNIENRALLGDLRRELDAMEASAGPDSALLRGIREVRGGFAIYDKVFHEVVEPRIMPAWK